MRMPGAWAAGGRTYARRHTGDPLSSPRTRENGLMSALDTRSSTRADAPGAIEETGADLSRGEATRHLVRMRYMPGLDGLRAFAVTGVLLYHATLNWIPGGFLGVDVFFVISGYLITSLLLAEFRNQGQIGLGQFYLRRARRLLPALFLLLGVVGLFAVVFLPDEVDQAAGRRRRRALLRHQLVADLSQPLVLRGGGSPAAAPAPLVARGRGAVLSDLAVAAHRHVQALARAAAPDAARDARHDRAFVRAHDRAVDPPRLPARSRPVARLLRHRHAPRSRCSSARCSRWSGHRGASRTSSRAARASCSTSWGSAASPVSRGCS